MPVLEKPSDGLSMGLFPHLSALFLGQGVALVQVVMAFKTEGRDPVIVSLDALALPVAQLV
jgi:hypothetical protein